jgi:threonyl-tRNA synthetase
MLVVGDKESAEGTVSVRSRSGGDLGPDTIDGFVSKARNEVSSKGAVPLGQAAPGAVTSAPLQVT